MQKIWVLSGRHPRKGNGDPLQYSCLRHLMNSGAGHVAVHRVTKESNKTLQSNNDRDTVKGFSIVNEIKVDAFLKFSCFFYDPTDVGNLISGSSAFSKLSLYIWTHSVHILLKPSLQDFEH